MYCTNISLMGKYDRLYKNFRAAYAFMERLGDWNLAEDVIELNGEVKAFVQSYDTISPQEAPFETHDAYFDIQLVLSGEEFLSVAPRANLHVAVPYCQKKDITFYEAPSVSTRIHLCAGDFAILSPDEAHQPKCWVNGPTLVKKIVIKIPVQPCQR